MIGRLSGTAALQFTPSGQVDNRIFTYGMVPRGLKQTKEALKLFSATISGLKINKDEMRLAAAESLVGATDLAEEIMMKYGINAQVAHSIVGRAIRFSNQEGQRLNADLINDAAKDIINCSFNISDDYIAQIMDIEAIIETRTGPGGASSKSVHTMITDLRSKINDCNHWMTLEKSWLKKSEKNLVEKVQSICQCT
jgi:argininosuccinate lyase